MRKTLVVALLALFAIGANAADKKEGTTSNKPVFTVVKQIPITSIKDQNRSGTCWDYSTLSYFEAEILKKTGKTSVRALLQTRHISIVLFKWFASMAIVSLLKVVQHTTCCTHLRIMASAQRMQCLSQALSMATH